MNRAQATRTVVIIGRDVDPHVALLRDALTAVGAEPLIVGGGSFAHGTGISYRFDGGASVRLYSGTDGRPVTDVQAVWWRGPPDMHVSPLLKNAEAQAFAEHQCRALAEGAFRELRTYWMNHPDALAAARYKLIQLRLASECGLLTPVTLASDRPDEISWFFQRCGGRVVTKLVSNVPPPPVDGEPYSVYTSVLRASDLAVDTQLSSAPALYQEHIPKEHELRVTVVGRTVVACRIDSQAFPETATDWRRFEGDRVPPHELVDLDQQTEAACLRLTARMGLEYAAIDLIVTPDGDVVFLELNPSGAWAWLDEAAELGISDLIAQTLVGANDA